MKKKVIYFLVCILGIWCMPKIAKAQDCPTPTSVTLSSSPAVCLGQGTVTVLTVNGAAAPNDSTVRYQLVYDSAKTSVIKPWQQSPVFASVPVGTYDVQIETVCGNNLSAIYTSSSVSVTGVTSAPTITGYTILSKALSSCNSGNSGSFTVTATTGNSTPYTYALLRTPNDPTQPPTGGYVVPQQQSDTFTNVAAGTYYVRVYDACGNWSNYSTPIVVAAAAPPRLSLAPSYYACDSLLPFVAVTNNNYITSSTPASTDRFWYTYNGVTDTIPNSQWNYTGISVRLSTITSPTYPFTITLGYSTTNACGKLEIDSTITINAPTISPIFQTLTTSTNCTDSVTLQFSVRYGGVGQYSLDSGKTWINYNFGVGGGSAYINIPVRGGTTVSIMFRNSCGTYTFTQYVSPVAAIKPPNAYLAEDNRVACNGNSGFVVGINYTSGGYGPSSATVVTVLSQPAGANLPASWTYTPDPQSNQYYGIGTGIFGDTHLTSNLPLGTYQIHVTGIVGQCSLTTDTTMTITLTKPANYSISSITPTPVVCNSPSQSGFVITMGYNYAGGGGPNTGAGGAINSFTSVLLSRAIVTNLQTGVVDSVTAVTTSGGYAISTPLTIDGANMANQTNIVPGTYRVQIVELIGSGFSSSASTSNTLGAVPGYRTPASCILDTTVTVTWGGGAPLTVASSIAFGGCSDGTAVFALQAAGGSSGNYTYSLYSVANGDTTLVQGPQSSGIFNGLDPNTVYTSQISDGCSGLFYAVSFTNQPLDMSNTGSLLCPADTFSMSIPSIPLGVYSWNVNWYNNAQANTEVINAGTNPPNSYTVIVPSAAGDSSTYIAGVNLGTCLVQSKPYTLRPANCTLPITLSSFSVQPAKTTAVVTWTTETEINNKGFYVQRSSNGANFTDLAFVASKANNGNSSGELNYSYTDKTPSPGINYYRLRQVDFNGTVSYSGVQSVTFNSTGTKAYPNPANSVLNVQLPANAVNASYELINSAGQVAAQGSLQSGNNAIAIGNLANGIYILKLTANGVTNSYKVSIVH